MTKYIGHDCEKASNEIHGWVPAAGVGIVDENGHQIDKALFCFLPEPNIDVKNNNQHLIGQVNPIFVPFIDYFDEDTLVNFWNKPENVLVFSLFVGKMRPAREEYKRYYVYCQEWYAKLGKFKLVTNCPQTDISYPAHMLRALGISKYDLQWQGLKRHSTHDPDDEYKRLRKENKDEYDKLMATLDVIAKHTHSPDDDAVRIAAAAALIHI